MAETAELANYIIKGGDQGRARLSVLSQVLAPTTGALFDRFEPLAGAFAIDAGCGGGDVSFGLAERVGPSGRVLGFDLDEGKLEGAREEAARRGLENIEFVGASVLDEWPASAASLVHIRFVLCHLPKPEDMLTRAMAALAPGGLLIAQDIDHAGMFCHPPSSAFARYCELYVALAQQRGGDPFIGRRLLPLLEGAGLAEADACLAQPFGRTGDVKQVGPLTFAAVSDALISSGLASAGEVERISGELDAYTARQDTTTSLPRIFQAWGCKQ